MMVESPTAALARFAGVLSLDDVPSPVVRAVKRLVPDHLGCALDLMDRVDLETDPAAQATWETIRHSALIPATVLVETPAGTVECARRHARGGPDEPLTWEETERKYRELAEPVLSATGAARVLEHVDKLETVASLTRLTAALTPGGGEP